MSEVGKEGWVREYRPDVFVVGHRRPEPLRTVVALVWVVALALSPALALWLGMEFGRGSVQVAPSPPVPVVSEVISDDDPRWDCRTMGNRCCDAQCAAGR